MNKNNPTKATEKVFQCCFFVCLLVSEKKLFYWQNFLFLFLITEGKYGKGLIESIGVDEMYNEKLWKLKSGINTLGLLSAESILIETWMKH